MKRVHMDINYNIRVSLQWLQYRISHVSARVIFLLSLLLLFYTESRLFGQAIVSGSPVSNISRDNASVNIQNNARQFMENQPVKFVENKGQFTDSHGRQIPDVLFKASSPGMDMYITNKGLTYVFVKAEEEEHREGEGEVAKAELCVVNMNLAGADIKKKNIIKEGPSVTEFNFFLSHCREGIHGVKEYEKITIKEIYPGIDWVLYSSGQKGFKYDFVVNAGANPDLIKLNYSSPEPVLLNNRGEIRLKTTLGTLQEDKPVSFQNENIIETRFIKTHDKRNDHGGYDTEIKFLLSEYNVQLPLIVDPQLWWSTAYGGTAHDGPTSVKCDANGNVFVSGYGASSVFPLMDAGTYYQTTRLGWEGFILKFNSSGVRLWATYYGGSGTDIFYCITTDLNDNVYVTGYSDSPDFPVKSSGGFFQPVMAGLGDAVILKFDNSGNRLWSTYYGGSSYEFGGMCITADLTGNIFVAGNTSSANLPVLNPAGGAYFQGVYAGGDIPNYYYAGGDAFILKFDNTQTLKWATYYGGSGVENCFSVATDLAGNVFVCGYTGSADLPTQNPGGTTYFNGTLGGAFDAYILKFSNSGVRQWATYYGGSGNDWGMALVTDQNDNLFVLGYTGSANLPVQNAGGTTYFDGVLGGTYDAYLLKFNNAGVRQWATYYGGSGNEIAFLLDTYKYIFEPDAHIVVDVCNDVYAAFETFSTDIATMDPACGSFYDGTLNNAGSAFNNDIFLSKFDNAGTLLWATYWGSSLTDFREGLATDIYGAVYMVGEWCQSTGTNYITVNPGGGAYYDAIPDGANESYICKFTPTLPVYTPTQSNPGPCLCNGTATVTVSCGTPPYNYSWSNGVKTLNTSGATNTVTGLCPGNYTVKVTDSNCNINSSSVSYTLTGASGSLTLNNTRSNVKCNSGCDGEAAITASGGTPPYTYLWDTGQTTSAISGLCAGLYSVAVTDANNCTSVQSIDITQPVKFTLGFSTFWSCSSNKASATVFPGQGTPPYTYLWSNGQTTSTASGLNAGMYTATVTDMNGCTTSGSINAEYTPAVITFSIKNNTCNANGSVTVQAVGVSPTYSWSTGSTAATFDNPAPGTYTVTVVDGNLCVVTKTVNVTNNSPVSATFTNPPTACIGTNVNFINTGTSGGTATYSWKVEAPVNVSGTTNDFSYTFLSTGTYKITHQVFIGSCLHTVTNTIVIVNCPGGPTITTTEGTLCTGLCTMVSSNVLGGTQPYAYSWSTGETTQNINPCPVSSTIYTVTVTDGGGNTATSTAVVTVNPAVTVTTTSTNITCSGTSTGSATATGGGGTPGFTYTWSNGGTTSQITNLTSQIYIVTVTDSKGCTSTSAAAITSPPPLTAQYTKGTANCSNCGCKEWVMVTGSGGTQPYSYTWSDGYDKRYKNALCPGIYNVIVTDGNGCKTTVKVNAP